MLNRSASLAMSTSVLEALPGRPDLKSLTEHSIISALSLDALNRRPLYFKGAVPVKSFRRDFV